MKRRTLRSKIIFAVASAVLIVSVVLGGLSILFSRDVLSGDAYEMLGMLCENEVGEINGTIEKIEQSVNSLSAITIETIELGEI